MVKARKKALVLSWKTPAGNGGSPVTGYRVQYSANNGKTWKRLSATATRITVNKLKTGKKYRVRVAVHNAAGWGAGCWGLSL